MNSMRIIAGREVLLGLRNRWVIAATLLLATLSLTLAFLGSAPTGHVGAGASDIVVVSLSSLSIFLVPLIALLIAHDAITGEIERGTMPLLLSYPLRRWHIVIGKFAGHVFILLLATAIGYGTAAAALTISGAELLRETTTTFATMIGSSVLLGAVFIAIGYCISAAVRDRGTAAAIAIGAWLLLVLIYDMALLGVLVADQGRSITAFAVNVLLLLNPTDVYRLFNLTASAGVSQFAGMAGLATANGWGRPVLLAALTLWTAVPLVVATAIFTRKEI